MPTETEKTSNRSVAPDDASDALQKLVDGVAWETLFASAKDCVFIKDLNHRYIRVNKTMAHLLGTDEQTLQASTDEELLGHAAAAEIRTADEDVFKGNTTHIEYPWPPQRPVTTLHLIKTPIKNSAGAVIGLLGIARDVSLLKEKESVLQTLAGKLQSRVSAGEAQLREAAAQYHAVREESEATEAYLKSIIEASHDGILVVDADGRFEFANPAALRIFGRTEQEFISAHFTEMIPEHQQAFIMERWEEVQDDRGEPYEVEIMLPDGTLRSLYASHTKLLLKGEAKYSVVVKDITDQKIAQAALQEARDKLEKRVEKRTRELSAANQRLQKEVIDRMRAEERLRVSEERFRTQYKNIPVPTYTWRWIDDDLVLVDYNDAAHTITQGYIANAVGVTASVLHKNHPEVRNDLYRSYREKITIHKDVSLFMEWTNEQKELAVTYTYVHPDIVMVHTQDVTQQKQSEDALRRSEERFRSLIEKATECVYVVDQDHVIRYASSSVERVLGYARSELQDQYLFTAVHPEDIDELLESYERFLAQRHGVFRIRCRVQHKNGTWRHLEGMATNLLENKAVGGIVINFRDITDRAVAEKRISKLNETFLGLGPDHRENIKLLVHTAGELLGGACVLYNRIQDNVLCTWAIWNEPPEYQHMSNPEGHICTDVIRGGEDRPVTIDHLDKTPYACSDPNVRKYGLKSYLGFPVRVGDRVVGSFCLCDTTDRSFDEGEKRLLGMLAKAVAIEEERRAADLAMKEKEARFRNLANLLPQIIYEMDIEGNLTFVNRPGLALIGYSETDIEHGLNAFDLIHDDDQERVRRNVQRRMNGEIEEPNEYRIIRKDGTIFPADVYSSVILRNERPQGLRGIVIDITERKEAEKRQRQITRDLQAVVEIADELIKCRTMDEIYRRAVELIRGKLDVERCSIFIRDDDCVTGTFGTDLQGNTVDERDYRNKLTGRWKRFFDTPVGKGRRWIAEEMDQHLLEGEDFSTIGFGWVVRTPIALEHERPDALLFNDTATSRRPMDAAKQDVLAVLCSLLADITANKRMQDELRLSEQRYRTIFQTTGTASAIVDRHKRFVLVNQRFEELSGYTSRDLLTDKTWDEFLAPEDRERQMRAYAERKDVPAEEPREYDFRFLRKNGEHRFVHLNVSQIPGTDRIVASLEDRTELKTTLDALQTSEKRFREMAELLPETIFEIDTENRFTYVNRRALELFGYTQQDIDEGVDVFSLFPEDERARVRENLKRRLAEEEVGGQEYVVTRKDGSTLPVMIYANRIVKGGKGVGLRGIVIDISERKKAEEERKALAARLLEVQEEERTKISSSLHDQLGQLLFLAKLDIDSVQPYDEASKQARNNSLRRLDEALYSMRHLARSLRPPLLDNLGMCTAMETLAEEVIEGTQLQIDFKCENNVPTLKSSVETSLYRVLQEALTNVVKHSQATRVSVRVDVEEQYVTLRVKDNGKGIHSGDTFAGSGLGLIGMRERMHRCSGELDIDAAADRGTELIARVPIAPNIREEETE